jgi:hypothetical protein
VRWHHQHNDRLLEVILMDLPPPRKRAMAGPKSPRILSRIFKQVSAVSRPSENPPGTRPAHARDKNAPAPTIIIAPRARPQPAQG